MPARFVGRETALSRLGSAFEDARAHLVRLSGAPGVGRRRLVDEAVRLHQLRATCGSYHVNSAVHGVAGPFLAAKSLGHGVAVAEKHYTRAIPGADVRAETLEGAMKATELFGRILPIAAEDALAESAAG